MSASSEANFKRQYQTHLKHLRLKGLRPKTIEAYARGVRRIGTYFDQEIDDLSEEQLTDYFTDLLAYISFPRGSGICRPRSRAVSTHSCIIISAFSKAFL